MQKKTLVLSEPLEWNGSMITHIDIKPPVGRDYLELGEPFSVIRAIDGTAQAIANDDVIRSYVQRAASGSLTAGQIDMLSLPDAIQLREAVLDFFSSARTPSPSTT